MASHEFRTPLKTISSCTDLIRRYDRTEQQPNREKHIERIRSSIKHMISLLDDFLSVGRLE